MPYKDLVTIVAYVDNLNHPPKNYAADTEAYRQFAYTGRKKIDKETLNKCLEIQTTPKGQES